MAEGGEMMSNPDYLKDADTQEATIRGRMLAKVTDTVDKSVSIHRPHTRPDLGRALC